MTPEVQKVHGMIEKFAQSVGVDPKKAFDPEKKAWYFQRGSARIEVFVQGIPLSNGEMRYFLRIFSPIMKIPAGRECEVYKHLLELNDQSLGVKLTLMPNSNQVYATYERDIQGLDDEELATCMLDLGWWADKLDDQLQITFSSDR
ncbi:MAG: hypothetical protein KatS3mg033_2423 [Thermonema sp.]|jgi:hypothetical protein|uniref:YbjN domain-containing protein n=1 Tax=Thermonema TaxID=28194 RepID=UPI0005700287|nr:MULTISPECIES: YbjN domain-containing protein [Thermonema]GIV40623.1 MAG: hypothetical protein KatS3mg033_2423 [Thermonema sp.]